MWGVETSEESVACALENAELNGITNAAFFAGDVGRFARGAARALRPAGRGRRSTLRAPVCPGRRYAESARLEAERIVYVSCNPTTLAGNVKALVNEFGYRLERVRPVDMFPHTPHVEAVALFTRA